VQRADKRKYHYIYKITRDDGRYYIGMHSTDNLDDGYFGSGKKITRSIKKHGVSRHSKKILEFTQDRISLKLREKEIITEEMRGDPLCKNLAPGGGGGFIDEEHKRKCCSAGGKVGGKIAGPIVGRMKSAKDASFISNLQRYGVGNKPTFGFAHKRHSEKTKKQMSESGLGEKNSQFGTCWVTKDSKPMKIKKEQLDEYLANGYSRGRK
jgi:hypothetical protein